MSWKIISKPIDIAEVSTTDTQTIYLVYVRDAIGNNIEARQAYGVADRTIVTKEFIQKYGSQHILKIEHEEQ
tara:strand:- start:382 stop:597 length:216 start_codon:yes stop_codon:yes gene_type:complete